MGALPTGVTVLAVRDASGEPVGLTVNAVASVSLIPPMLLVCIHQRARVRALLRRGASFVLNVLSTSQADIARCCASAVPDRFAGIDYAVTSGDAVVIKGVVAHIKCTIRDIAEVGDHSVVYADVTGGQANGGRPLLFTGGKYSWTDDNAPASE